MKSKNEYSLFMEGEDVQYVISGVPAHRVFYIEGKRYNLTDAVDVLCDEGSDVFASLEGKVVAVNNSVSKNWNKNFEPPEEVMSIEEQDGNYVVLEHDNEELTIYCHLKKDSICVEKGVRVGKGQKIALSGNTGYSREPHVHFMVHYFPERNNGGFESLEPRWDLRSEKILKERTISHEEFQDSKR